MKLKKQMLHRIRAQGKSDETWKTYWHWCERFLRWIRDRRGEWVHPIDLNESDVEAWLDRRIVVERSRDSGDDNKPLRVVG